MKKIVKRASKIITISHFSKNELEKNYGIKAEVIYNGYDDMLFYYDKEQRSIIRNLYNINSYDIVFISVGRMIPYKDPISVVYKFNDISKDMNNSKLIFIGQGILLEQVKKVINELNLKDRVIFIDKINNKEMYKYYSASDYFISGCGVEGFGLAALEALSCNCIPLLPYKGAFPEIFKYKCFLRT